MTNAAHHIAWFRHTGPYIKAHRGRTFVVYLGNGALESVGHATLIHDVALLHSLGINLVLVHATREAIDAALPPTGRRTFMTAFALPMTSRCRWLSRQRRGSGCSWSNSSQWGYPTRR